MDSLTNSMYALKNTGPKRKKEALSGEELYDWLLNLFKDEVVTETDFMRIFKISHYQLASLRKKGCAPEMIILNSGSGAGRYLVADIARWIENNRSQGRKCNPDGTSKRGRPRKKPMQVLEQAVA